uniref:Protein FAR1-RELATED SEQUENCE 4-like n=1 Tax=Nicotiana tabacum TaxID=4097 RepID=A0A1S3Y0G8_TOBAC|nr:PREDICTED: protein FAR1-RELATED SEQUENCE 4-like [Nicotiana tabacum]
MDTICIIVAFNDRWTADYKYLDHQTKLVLVPEAIRFENFINQVFEVIELDRDKFEAMIWFDINLGTSKGMLVSKDLDLHTCIELLKRHSLFKGCRFIVDISERVFGSTSTFEHVNIKTQQHNQDKCQQIMEIDVVEAQPITEEVLQIFDSIQVEGQSIIEIDNEQALGIQVLESAPIVKIEKNHDCLVNTMKADQRHATSKLISGYIIDNLRDPRFEVTPAFVMAEMQKLHGLDIGYHKAWRVIQRASALIRGSPEENYELLSSYLYMMKSKNSGTYTNIKIDDNNRFLFMFYAYGSSIAGWNHCRPVIVIDATFLKSKYRVALMILVSKDANNQIFPLAFGIAESENNNSYEWYFSELRNAIGSRDNLIFLSDRHQSIAHGIAKVYPESHHGICIYHLEQNLKRRKVKSEVIKLFQSAARVYKRKEFDLYMSDITKVDKKTFDYLMEEPPERWERSCSPRRRYDMLTTNIVESMNSVLLEARELPILRMMDFIQVKLQCWFYERKNKAKETFYDVSCWVEEELKKKIYLAFTLNVFPVDSWHSRVEEEGITFLVDLNKRTCDCFQFQFDELPCIHAIAAIKKRNIKKSNFCSDWYLKES